MILQKGKKLLYTSSIKTLKRYNKEKVKPDAFSIFLEKCIFWAKMGVIPNFKKPTSWGEFIGHRKFYGDYKKLANVADKLMVRNYVKKQIGEKYLQDLYDVVESTDDISEEKYQKYPEQFVAKPNHASERVFINKKYNYSHFRKSISGFLKEFGNRNNEFHYKQISRKLLIEEYLNPTDEPLKEYKIWVYNGKAEIIVPSLSIHDSKLNNNYRFRLYDRNWNEPNVQVRDNPAPFEKAPAQLSELIEISEKLATGWDFIRVDLFLADGAIKFGELTPTPSAGRSFFLSLDDHRYIFDTFLRPGTDSSV